MDIIREDCKQTSNPSAVILADVQRVGRTEQKCVASRYFQRVVANNLTKLSAKQKGRHNRIKVSLTVDLGLLQRVLALTPLEPQSFEIHAFLHSHLSALQ